MKILKNYKFYLIMIVTIIIVLVLYNMHYYKINLNNNYKKSFLYYKNLEMGNSNRILKFMKYISDGKYEMVFELLTEENKINMFDNSVESFINKLKIFENSYSEVKYNTIFSTQQANYLEEEIICSIYDNNNVEKHSVRVNIRNYKNDNNTKIMILNIN